MVRNHTVAHSKINTKVLKSERIVLPTIEGKASYVLTDTISHMGDLVDNGHYVLYNIKESRCYDDQPGPSFDPVDEEDLEQAKRSSYIYFYKLDSVERYV